MPLTDLECRNAKPQDKDYKLHDTKRMHLLVKTNGAKYFILRYILNQKEKSCSLGIYPSMSLSDARTKRDEFKELIKQGIDPVQEKQKIRIKENIANANIFKLVALEWLEINKHKYLDKCYIVRNTYRC